MRGMARHVFVVVLAGVYGAEWALTEMRRRLP